MFFRPSNQLYRHQNRAFGLVELMVSISIMTLVTTVVLVRQSAFDGAVLLRNQAYEVAFTIRQAQQLAVTGGDATRRYGVHFSTNSALDKEYFLFADSVSDQTFDIDDDTLVGQTGRLDNRFYVREVFVGSDSCTTVTVMFERPNFDSQVNGDGGSCGGVSDDENVYIDIAREGRTGTDVGTVRRVEVTPAGQISVVTY